MAATALRTTLIWHDEVMGDVVHRARAAVTLGATGKSTFTIADVDLPPNFAMFSPGSRGYVMTLGSHMRGTMCVDGREQDVGELVQRGEDDFHATPIGERDWGLVDLDESGAHKLFFQFVPVERERGRLLPLLVAAMVAWLACGAIVGGIAGLALATVALVAIGLGYWFLRCDNELQLSHVFSLVLHGALIAVCIVIYEPTRAWAFSDPNDLTADYYVTRLTAPVEEPVERPTPTSQIAQPAAAPTAAPVAAPSAPKGPISTPTTPIERTPLPPVGLMHPRNVEQIQKVIDRGLKGDLDKFLKLPTSPDGGPGSSNCRPPNPCSGTNTDDPKRPGPTNSGFKPGDKPVVEHPKPGDCVGDGCNGGGRPKRPHITLDNPGGDMGEYSSTEIARVVGAMSGLYRSCYQKALNHVPELAGTVTVHFTIDGNTGAVTSASGNGLGNAEVESCVVRNVYKLHFDLRPGTTAHVTYPFVFSSGG